MNPASGAERSLRRRLDALVEAGRVPGLQYAAVSAHGPVFEYAVGWANLALGRPMDAGTTQMAYSMSKTITAAAVLTLVDEGKLGVDDSIDRYLDGSPYGSKITIRHLLAHTSGIPNPVPLRWVHAADHRDGFDEAGALAQVLVAHPRVSSEPGARYAYSNIGYWLLGPIVERASGRPFTTYAAERVLAPLGIAPGELGYDIPDPARHATGYLERWSLLNFAKGFLLDRTLIGARVRSWIEIRSHLPNGPAFGGLVGSARRLGTFLADQLRPRSALLGERARALFYEPQRATSGRPVPMTLGWHVGVTNGRRYFFKEGGGGGFHGLMRLYPAQGLGTVAIANATGFDAAQLLDAADRSFMV
jgi:CubicO group peptidase (beta-lactamase class C family)